MNKQLKYLKNKKKIFKIAKNTKFKISFRN